MATNWNPFNREEQHVIEPEAKPNSEAKPPEKTPAELIAESLKPFTDSINAKIGEFQTKLDEVSAATKRPARTESTETPTTPSVFDNEDQAFAVRVGPLYMRQLETEARLSRDDVRAEYIAEGFGDAWGQFAAEINKILDDSPLVNGQGGAVRGDKAYIRNVVDMVFGRAAKNSGLKFGGKDRGFFVETAGGSADSVNSGPVNDGLTTDQRRVFARMKGPDGKPIASEAIKSTMSKLKFVN